MNAWYTIFIDLDRSFISGLSQVLYSLAVIELAKPGLEATTYELIITVGNACGTVNGIISTQLLLPLKTIGCSTEPCPDSSVDITSKEAYFSTNGPHKFTVYTLTLLCISVSSCLIFVWNLPRSKNQCHEWKEAGELSGNSPIRGYISLFLAAVMIIYGFIAAILLLDPATSCLPSVGGIGC